MKAFHELFFIIVPCYCHGWLRSLARRSIRFGVTAGGFPLNLFLATCDVTHFHIRKIWRALLGLSWPEFLELMNMYKAQDISSCDDQLGMSVVILWANRKELLKHEVYWTFICSNRLPTWIINKQKHTGYKIEDDICQFWRRSNGE